MFYDRFVALCKEQGIAQSKAVQIIGLNRSAITKWKTGSTPNGETVKKLADLFGVTADYLLGNVNEPYFYLDNQRIADEINSLDEYEKKAQPRGWARKRLSRENASTGKKSHRYS